LKTIISAIVGQDSTHSELIKQNRLNKV